MISFVVPIYNEGPALLAFHNSLMDVIHESVKDAYEIIYCDDGSEDNSAEIAQRFCQADKHVKLVKLSRNFGKESALVAGIATAAGDAIITLDGDGQHPVESIPQFIDAWRHGAQVVVGIRLNPSGKGWLKRAGPKLFYPLLNKLTNKQSVPGSSDFRLIDKAVQRAFLSMKETDRITRGLIDWLGFKRVLIPFEAKDRVDGKSSYNWRTLFKLATHSFVSLTPVPLYIFGFVGVFITVAALLLGGVVFVEQVLLNDPWHWQFTGTAMLSILLVFLVGTVLMSQGILSLYISHMHNQSKQRPLYVIDYAGSAGIKDEA